MQSTEVQPLVAAGGDFLPTVAPHRRDVFIGFAFTALVPAVFWATLLAFVAFVLGYEPSLGTIGLVTSTIVLFLSLIFAMLRTRSA